MSRRQRTNSLALTRRLAVGELDSDIVILGVCEEEEFVSLDIKDTENLEENIGKMQVIAQGNQGKIYRIKIIFTNEYGEEEERDCVLKRVEKLSPKKWLLDLKQKSKVTEMKNIISKINQDLNTSTDRNIIKLITLLETDEASYQLMPFCDLFLNHVAQQFQKQSWLKNTPLHQAVTLHILSDILIALNYLHESGYVHGDVKSDNIAFYRGHWCLIDFDSSHQINQSTIFNGTPFFAHPACFDEKTGNLAYSNPKNDLYGLGITIKLFLQEIKLPEEQGDRLYQIKKIMDSKTKQYQKTLKKEAITEKIRKEYACIAQTSPQVLELQDDISFTDQLSLIATFLTQNLFDKIPDISWLIAQCEQLKESFIKEHNITENQVQNFYQTLILQNTYTPVSRDKTNSLSSQSSFFSQLSLFSSSSSRRSSEQSNSGISQISKTPNTKT